MSSIAARAATPAEEASVSDVAAHVVELGVRARAAGRRLAAAPGARRIAALEAIAEVLDDRRGPLVEANARDLAAGEQRGLSAPMLDRLRLDDAAIDRMVEGVRQVAALPDPVGAVSDVSTRPSGIRVGRMRVPLGVVAIIYESRPNVTVDAAALCLKSGNATLLRGGSEAFHSNVAIADCVREGLARAGLPEDAVQLLRTTDRAAVDVLVGLTEHVDVVIPRGGRGLIERIAESARVPVLKHLDGNCHVYVDAAADPAMAEAIVVNGKCQRYGVCNAVESLLVHAAVASTLLPVLGARLQAEGVELRGCERTCELLSQAVPATEDDWDAEYLGPVLAVRVVDDLDAAIEHVNRHGSAHTDAIVTSDLAASNRFLAEVDSATVMVNASPRFADGFEFGLGAEIGISTDKLHARGPVGLEGLTTQKFVVFGDGQVRT